VRLDSSEELGMALSSSRAVNREKGHSSGACLPYRLRRVGEVAEKQRLLGKVDVHLKSRSRSVYLLISSPRFLFGATEPVNPCITVSARGAS
jgi:hypothetical protein